ncbi:hypothetical protein [Chamaesiphon sp. GL140_3_metabinner_50]|uniref:hypothetical protein n=1 Tax=Chamaesiphon sp. GL140_3_metabinner_50 TaxID=2970812 RepID=UPI0025DAE97B|nr:hypothetical protein [Chamaesiphon sp. GL140_3_metabinner_50]
MRSSSGVGVWDRFRIILKISIKPANPTDNRSIVTIHESLQSIEHHHLPTIENRSIFASGVGRVRSQFLEFGDDR